MRSASLFYESIDEVQFNELSAFFDAVTFENVTVGRNFFCRNLFRKLHFIVFFEYIKEKLKKILRIVRICFSL